MASAALSIECSDQPLDLSFHPSKANLVAVGLVDGTVEVHDILQQQQNDEDDEDDTIVSSTAVHTQLIPTQNADGTMSAKPPSCRTVQYAHDGRTLWTGGSGGDLARLDAERIGTFSSSTSNTGATTVVTSRVSDAGYGKSPIQVLYELPEQQQQQQLWVTGDEAGAVRVWDARLMGNSNNNSNNANTTATKLRLPAGCVAGWKVHEDYVSGIEHHDNTLLASSADGTLSVYDLRMAGQQQPNRNGLLRQSDHQEDELLSIKIMKHGKKVVCGTGEGVLSVFSYGTWGDVSDRFPGHPNSIDALVKVDEDTLLTGSSDGLIRVVSIHPDKFIGVLGDNHEGFPIEKLQFNADRKYVGSITHDNFVRLWDARLLLEEYDDNDDDEAEDAKMSTHAPAVVVAPTQASSDNEDDWEDMDAPMEEDSDDDSDSDSDDSINQKTANDKRAGRFKTENEKFFDDL